MKLFSAARPPVLLSLILFSVIFMTFWWRNLFSTYLDYYTQAELFRAELELTRAAGGNDNLLKALKKERKVRIVPKCSDIICVRYESKFIEIDPFFRKTLAQTRHSRWNMIWWETSFLIILLIISGAFLLIIHFRDKTREKEADDFAAMAAHELKHPISSLSLLLQSLKRKSIPAGKQAKFIDKGLAEISSLREQIDVLLKLKDTANYRHLEKDAYIVNALMRDIADDLCSRNQSWGRRIILEPSEQNLLTTINRESLTLICKNILENALLYSEKEVRVNFSKIAKFSIIAISDQGIGFTRDDRKKIGNMFFRSSRYQVQNIKGSGIGLFTVYKLAKLTGVKIDLFSEGEIKAVLSG